MSEEQRQQRIKRLQSLNSNIKLLEYKNNKTKAKFQCQKCGELFEMFPNSFIRRNGRCPCCENKRIDNKKASVAEIYPELVSWFVNKEEANNYGSNSHKEVKFKCPDCGYEFTENIRNFCKRVNHCLSCKTDGISRPNKFLRELLKQVEDQLSFKKLEWDAQWEKHYRYDGYIITKDGNAALIEMQGEQHYHETNWGRHDYQLLRDAEKKSLAKEREIELIEIECKKTAYSYMRTRVLESRLAEILDLSCVDWNKIALDCSQNYLKIVSDYYKQGMGSTQIGKLMDFDRHTIQRMLEDASEMGWIDYKPVPAVELFKKDLKIIDVIEDKEVIMHGITEACRWLRDEYGVLVDRHTIKDYFRGERVLYYGGKHIESLKGKLYKNRFKFEYLDKNKANN